MQVPTFLMKKLEASSEERKQLITASILCTKKGIQNPYQNQLTGEELQIVQAIIDMPYRDGSALSPCLRKKRRARVTPVYGSIYLPLCLRTIANSLIDTL